MAEENKLKGLFGGGEASDQGEAAPRGDGGRRRRGGGGRRRRSAEERDRAHDFINRYTAGNPAEGFSSDEAVNYLRELRQDAPPEVLRNAAVETVRNLPEDQRKAFAEMLQRRQAGTGMVTIDRAGEAHQTAGRAPAAGGGLDDALGGLFGGLLGGTMAQPAPQPQPAPGYDDALGGLLGGLLGGAPPATERQEPHASSGNPLGDLFGGLFGGGEETPEPRQRQTPEQRGGINEVLSSPLGKAVLGGIAAYAMKEMMDREGRL